MVYSYHLIAISIYYYSKKNWLLLNSKIIEKRVFTQVCYYALRKVYLFLLFLFFFTFLYILFSIRRIAHMHLDSHAWLYVLVCFEMLNYG